MAHLFMRLTLALFIALALPLVARAEYQLLVYSYSFTYGFPVPIDKEALIFIESPAPPVVTPICGMEVVKLDIQRDGTRGWIGWLSYRAMARDVGVRIAAGDKFIDYPVQGDCVRRNAHSPAETLYIPLVIKE